MRILLAIKLFNVLLYGRNGRTNADRRCVDGRDSCPVGYQKPRWSRPKSGRAKLGGRLYCRLHSEQMRGSGHEIYSEGGKSKGTLELRR